MTGTTMFISFMLDGDNRKVGIWLLAIAIMAILVVVASLIDLHWGIRASKRIGQFKTTSFGLRKTVSKDKCYLTLYFFAVMIDACLSFFVTVPIASILMCAGEIVIEGVSVHEKMQQLKSLDVAPLTVAKAIANTYGVQDAEKIHSIVEAVAEGMGKGNTDTAGN